VLLHQEEAEVSSADNMGGSQSSHAVLDGDGGCYSVKCRSEPLMVHDRAVLRVTKEVRGPPSDKLVLPG